MARRPGALRALDGPVGAPPAPVLARRSTVDYALQRRARVQAVQRAGERARADACDADPYLLRAARHHGEHTAETCPVCRDEELSQLTYVFGDELGQYSGRIRATAELPGLAREHAELRVFVVEVCLGCGWNHLRASYVMGEGAPRRPPRRQHVVSDDD